MMVYLIEFNFLRGVARLLGLPVQALPKFNHEQKKLIKKAFLQLMGDWRGMLRSNRAVFGKVRVIQHLQRLRGVLIDMPDYARRTHASNAQDFTFELPAECPEYYKLNFHYQTDGYFTERSALLYDHQLELLFKGTGHILRKVGLHMLKPYMQEINAVLDVGAGTGASIDQYLCLYPETEIHYLDASSAYGQYTKALYGNRISAYHQGFIENIKLDRQYDLLFFCFVFHEIPTAIWDSVLSNISRHLREGGFCLIIDSQQMTDNPDYHYALEAFASQYFEPHFDDYRSQSIETAFEEKGFQLLNRRDIVFSKGLLFQK